MRCNSDSGEVSHLDFTAINSNYLSGQLSHPDLATMIAAIIATIIVICWVAKQATWTPRPFTVIS